MMNYETLVNDVLKGTEIYIHKEGVGQVRENCVYAESLLDVPVFLLADGSIVINEDGSITLHAVECPATRNFPVYICYEAVSEENKDRVPGEYGSWSKDNGDTTLKVVDGKCYNLPATVKASLITEEVPEWVLSAGFPVSRDADMYKLVRTDWGGEERVGRIGKALWVEYGEGDVNILDLAEKSASEYVITQDNDDIGYLTDVLVTLL